MSDKDHEQKAKLLQLMRDAVQKDNELRATYQIGDKFRFIREKLINLVTKVEESIKELEVAEETKKDVVAEDEAIVYIYLFNAQGLVFKSWQKLVTPSVFYEHSVNRPIYTDKNQVEAFIRSKTSKALHAFLTIIVKKQDILPVPAGLEAPKDAIGGALVKVREGSLRFERLVSFTHVEKEYRVTAAGEIILKTT